MKFYAVAIKSDGTPIHRTTHDSLEDASEALAGEFRLAPFEQNFLTSNLRYETEHYELLIEPE